MSVRGAHCDYSTQAPKSLVISHTTECCYSFVPTTNTQTGKIDPSPLLLVYVGDSHGDELRNPHTLWKSNRTHLNTQSLGQHGCYFTLMTFRNQSFYFQITWFCDRRK
jgi:hypothetical protein